MTTATADTAALLSARVRVPQHVVHRAFPSETVVLNLETGKYHGLNPVAGRMLAALEAASSVAEALRELQAEFPAVDTLQDDLFRLCRELEKRGILTLELPRGA